MKLLGGGYIGWLQLLIHWDSSLSATRKIARKNFAPFNQFILPHLVKVLLTFFREVVFVFYSMFLLSSILNFFSKSCLILTTVFCEAVFITETILVLCAVKGKLSKSGPVGF